jgi:hypothetical protein
VLFEEVVATHRTDLTVASGWSFDYCRQRSLWRVLRTLITKRPPPESVRNLPGSILATRERELIDSAQEL